MAKRNAPEFTWLEDKQLYRKKIKSPVTGKWVPVYGHTKQELREKIRQKEAALAEAAQEKENPLVYQYAARWYSLNTGDLSESRKEDYRNAINNHICPVIGGKTLREVKPDDILEVIAVSRKKAPSKSSQQKIVNTLKRIFEAADENGYVTGEVTLGLESIIHADADSFIDMLCDGMGVALYYPEYRIKELADDGSANCIVLEVTGCLRE